MSDAYTLDTSDLFIQTLVEKWMESEKIVESLDEKMDVESFGKTKLLNSAFTDVGSLEVEKNPLAKMITDFFNSEAITSDAVFVGFFETLRRIQKNYEARKEAFVDANVVTIPDSEKPKPEEIEEWRKERKKVVDAMNGIRDLLKATANLWFESQGDKLLRVMENKRGAIGKRGVLGKRLAGKFQFKVNGTILSDNKLSAIVNFLKSKVESVKEVREAIEAQNPNFDWENPPNNFEFNIAGAHVEAEKLIDDSPDEDSDDGDIEDIVTETADGDESQAVFFDEDDSEE